MGASGSGDGKLFGRFTEQAHRVLDRAREEAEWCGHRYLGPEHILLGLLADGQTGAAGMLWAHGVDLAGARAALRRLAERGVVPAPRPSDAELLGMLGVDLDAVRHGAEQTFGFRAVGEATWRVTHRRVGGAEGRCGRRCAARRWSPSVPCSWPASGRVRWAMARSLPSICCWECWRMRGSRRRRWPDPGGTGGSSRTSGCLTATGVRPGCCLRRLTLTLTTCERPSLPRAERDGQHPARGSARSVRQRRARPAAWVRDRARSWRQATPWPSGRLGRAATRPARRRRCGAPHRAASAGL